MSHPPPYYGPPPPWPPPPPQQPHLYPPHPPLPGHFPPPPPPDQSGTYPHPYPYYMPMMAIPVGVPTGPPPSDPSNPTYITNYIYHGETSNQPQGPPVGDAVQVVETSGDFDWIPTTSTTASHLSGKAVLGGHEGWDGSPLWVIRSWHNGDLIPGKLSVRHNAASIMYNGKEVPVQNIEVLCARPENLRWVPASNGNIPPSAIEGGRTASGETLYIGRARYQLSITPGKVQPSHNCCYIGFGGSEVSHRVYDVLCRIS
ncbi:sulfated surface glycoprotein 185-like [Ostrinia furnacalis]|uniref:sulfated surface glycoprotein 185-like n=1 Tax=Ostrinia furnacalis TaxID=93504 RepID=UPI00104089F4|nr:sulfated surface glycoprotein 185-like [Ostrinia furnacalis]